MRAVVLLLLLGCSAREAAPPAGLVARLEVEAALEGATLILKLRNTSTSPIPITAVEEWDESFPDWIHRGVEAEVSLKVERLSGATPRNFAVLDGPSHSRRREHRLVLLQPGVSRSFPRRCRLPPGEYEASAAYLYVDGEPLAPSPLRFRVEGTLSR